VSRKTDGAMTVSHGALSLLTPRGGGSESGISQRDQSNSAYCVLNQCGSATSSVCRGITDGAMTVSHGALKVVSKPLSLVIPSCDEPDANPIQRQQTSSSCQVHIDDASMNPNDLMTLRTILN